MRNIISGPVTTTVTLGQAGYGDRLTVTASGSIVPAYSGYDGLVVPNTLQDARVLNQGLIAGSPGYDGYDGGTGVSLGSGRLDNVGTLRGGQGGGGYGYGGTGGAGVDLGAGAALVNAGAIAAGTGGRGHYVGGTGGVGVSLSGGVLVNHGSIAGGSGGPGDYVGGNGGAGVLIGGGTLVDFGTLRAGSGTGGPRGGGSSGAAVQFGSQAGTLVLEPGAVVAGAVHANSAVADTLELAGRTAATVDGLGASGFSLISEDAHATWTLTGSVSGAGSISIGLAATLTLSASVSVASIAFAAGPGTLALGTSGQVTSTIEGFGTGDVIDLQGLTATSLSYGQGTLTVFDGGNAIDTLAIAGDLITADFSLRADGQGGTDIYGHNPFGGAVSETGSAAHGRDAVSHAMNVLGHMAAELRGAFGT